MSSSHEKAFLLTPESAGITWLVSLRTSVATALREAAQKIQFTGPGDWSEREYPVRLLVDGTARRFPAVEGAPPEEAPEFPARLWPPLRAFFCNLFGLPQNTHYQSEHRQIRPVMLPDGFERAVEIVVHPAPQNRSKFFGGITRTVLP